MALLDEGRVLTTTEVAELAGMLAGGLLNKAIKTLAAAVEDPAP
jgi:hypothetical protein